MQTLPHHAGWNDLVRVAGVADLELALDADLTRRFVVVEPGVFFFF